MSFDQLLHVAKLGAVPHHLLVHEWHEKRQHLAVYTEDLPRLVDEYRASEKGPYDRNPKITLVDPYPKIRLSSACEAASNCLYGMAEIAAQFANKVSGGALPSSFNAFRKNVEDGRYDGLVPSWVVKDLSWYKKVRELRTEWSHFSTVFVGENQDGTPIIVVRCSRRISDRVEFPKEIHVKVSDLVDWIQRAIVTIDNLGDFALVKYVIPKLDRNAILTSPKRDENGWPIIRDDSTFEVEKITVAEHLAQCGIRISE
ncbi:hypothetical protein [Methyloceanibacter sp.]|uniref:hypothetical protein n=1 Tax=Methyloceanibacter sp. TaxID=1965321 RepID=UPI003D6D1DCB